MNVGSQHHLHIAALQMINKTAVILGVFIMHLPDSKAAAMSAVMMLRDREGEHGNCCRVRGADL